ncbi:MAG: ribbon-helix-helix protein, CopG family [Verrucomicrobia bacterium]|nr:ribbon-helix-helix protein, CopG family [Verrucomicrobiota bacterium]
MRTTVSISDSLLDLAKKLSRERRSTLGEVIEEALRATLVPRSKSSVMAKRPVLLTYNGTCLREGVRLDSWAELLEVMDS